MLSWGFVFSVGADMGLAACWGGYATPDVILRAQAVLPGAHCWCVPRRRVAQRGAVSFWDRGPRCTVTMVCLLFQSFHARSHQHRVLVFAAPVRCADGS